MELQALLPLNNLKKRQDCIRIATFNFCQLLFSVYLESQFNIISQSRAENGNAEHIKTWQWPVDGVTGWFYMYFKMIVLSLFFIFIVWHIYDCMYLSFACGLFNSCGQCLLLLWQKFSHAVGLCRIDKMKNKIAQMLRQLSYSLIRR